MSIEQQFHDGVVLDDTVQEGPGFAKFHLPMNAREMLWQLAKGNPCQIPRIALDPALRVINRCFDDGRIKVEADAKIAQISPDNGSELKLNATGRSRVGVAA